MRNPSSSTSSSTTQAAGTKTPCCIKVGLKRGPWTPEEDELLANYINKEGEGKWRTLPKRAGLLRCGKSCRLRWMNYLRPCVKRGEIAPDEEDLILRLHRLLGNRWSLIAGRIPGRTDNEIKNYWNTHLSKKLISQGIDPRTHKPLSSTTTTSTITATNNNTSNHKYFTPPYSVPPPATPPTTALNNHSPTYYIAPSQESYSGGAGGTAVSPSGSGKGTTAMRAHPSLAVHQSVLINKRTSNGYLFDSGNDQTDQYPIISSVTAGMDHQSIYTNQHTTFINNKNNKKINGLSPSLDEEEDEEEGDVNYCTDDVFSSFLNSLINDDMFNNNSHSQIQQQHSDYHENCGGVATGTSDSLASAVVQNSFSFAAAGWDAPPIMSTPTPAFNHNQDYKCL